MYLSVSIYVYLSIHPSIHLSVYISVCLSNVYIYLSIHPSISVYPPVCLPACLCLSFFLPVYPNKSLCIIHLPVYIIIIVVVVVIN